MQGVDFNLLKNVQTTAVVALVGESVVHELVVVDTLARGLVVAGLLGVLEVRDVPDVGDGVTLSTEANAVVLIVLVVEEQVVLVLGVEDPALVGVRGALVRDAGDDRGVRLVRHVVDGQGVLVVAVADVGTLVLRVGAPVDQALGVVDVAVLGGATRRRQVLEVSQVDEDETRGARRVARLGADGDGVVLLLVGDDVVRAARRQLVPEVDVVLVVVGDGRGRVVVDQLRHVEDLDAVVVRLGPDHDVALVALDLAPQRRLRIGVLRQPPQVDQLALGADLGERRAVLLRDGDELAPLGARPPPGPGALAHGAAEVEVRLEVVQVEPGALELVVGVAGRQLR